MGEDFEDKEQLQERIQRPFNIWRLSDRKNWSRNRKEAALKIEGKQSEIGPKPRLGSISDGNLLRT